MEGDEDVPTDEDLAAIEANPLFTEFDNGDTALPASTTASGFSPKGLQAILSDLLRAGEDGMLPEEHEEGQQSASSEDGPDANDDAIEAEPPPLSEEQRLATIRLLEAEQRQEAAAQEMEPRERVRAMLTGEDTIGERVARAATTYAGRIEEALEEATGRHGKRLNEQYGAYAEPAELLKAALEEVMEAESESMNAAAYAENVIGLMKSMATKVQRQAARGRSGGRG